MCKIIVYTNDFEITTKIVSDETLELSILNMIDSDSKKYSLIDYFDTENVTFNDQVEHAVMLFNRIVVEYFHDYVNLAVVKDDDSSPMTKAWILAPVFSAETVFIHADNIRVTDQFTDFVIGFFRDRALNIVPLAGTEPIRFLVIN